MEVNDQENTSDLFESRLKVQELNHMAFRIRDEIAKVLVGQEKVLDLLLTALLSNGHVLLEGVPGVAKTLMARLLAKTLDTGFSRIQFTPDLMPSDVLGTSVFNAATSNFEFRKGPIFSNMVLIDEVNRAPAKTQSALFEVMEERQVTMEGHSHQLKAPFLVIATQNPIEHEGTYRLPEAQLDRFLFKIKVDYPDQEQELRLLQRACERQAIYDPALVQPVVSEEELAGFQKLVNEVIVEPQLLRYITAIVEKTRKSSSLSLGASPRASLALLKAARAFAALEGRDFVTPEDIREVLYPVLAHRVILSPEKEMEGVSPEVVLRQLVETVEVPR
ncbi:AAA family ATPase [Geofilum rhodophaeum]|uniref:AAA family ATPase n=1 Tax=Geofilum rhodophaeum TaxID=1965019 RepID=UPI000B527D12|nr:MoxR family ATPase [Geofilum rhodophaeum]